MSSLLHEMGLRVNYFDLKTSTFPLVNPFNTERLPFFALIAVCIYRYVITFGLCSKYDVLGHYFIFMIVLPSINKFNMTSHQFNMT